jgi:hypothetical protein
MNPSSLRTLSLFLSLTGLAVSTPAQPAQQQPETISQPTPPPSVNTDTDDRPAPDAARFKSLDTDADGRISRPEFSLSPTPVPHGGEMATVPPREKKHWWSRSPDTKRNNSGDLFDQLDANSDGYLSRDEIAGQTSEKKSK